ncbi:DUF4097 family beta strand repeat-containing protein [Clostridium sp. BL-8]|uniref:DUF4097 family beta strand repeat-containing protein n=1 Tax=Clostridium sp. BL-8 TaxID=349938 RepID=UPI0009C478BE|nr:DUF4097 family beta strand repeat-containing protein [Clostridium sp. BL-8]OOM76162.1 hypothetical protein CLOBL_37110 [Clostridium sp. BL-8]
MMKKALIPFKIKIFMLVLLLLSVALYASGCIVLVQSGYKLSDYADELNINPKDFKYNFNLNKFNFDFNATSTSKDYTISDNINEIDFNLNSQDVKVINYDGDTLNVQIKSHNTTSNELYETESNNKLILDARYYTPNDSTILVNVPKKFQDRGALKIVTSSGDVNISNLSLNTLNVSSASGSIKASNLNLTYLNFNTSSGDIYFNNTKTSSETKLTSSSGDINGSGNLGIITGSTSSGDINLQFINSLNNMSIRTHSGSVILSIPNGFGYKINYETVSGDLSSPNNRLTSGDESSLININTVSGDLNIK